MIFLINRLPIHNQGYQSRDKTTKRIYSKFEVQEGIAKIRKCSNCKGNSQYKSNCKMIKNNL